MKHAPAYLRTLPERLMALGLHLIPLDVGSKATHEEGWAAHGETTLALLLRRAERYLKRPCPATDGLNFGILHEPSRTVALDIDDARALDAIRAGLAYLALPDDEDWGGIAWTSPRGIKRLWRRPATWPARTTRLVYRERMPNGRIEVRTLLEVRASGQDAAPGSVRADANDFVLEPIGPLPDRVPDIPVNLARLFAAMAAGDAGLIATMQAAAGVSPELSGMDSVHSDEYPARLAGQAHARAVVNASLRVEDILTAAGYEPRGDRWRPRGSHHAAGIAPPKGRAKLWHCWHEGDALSGQVDAWRAFVELAHNGDLLAAVADAKSLNLLRALPDEAVTARATVKVSEVLRELRTGAQARLNDGEILTLDEIDEDDTPLPPVLMEGMLPLRQGTFLLAGRPKHGKSFLALSWALSWAHGCRAGTLGPTEDARKRPDVLYISLDDPSAARIKARRRQMIEDSKLGKARGKIDFCVTWPPAKYKDLEHEAALAQYLADEPKCGMVVIDTVVAWEREIADRLSDVYRTQYKALRPLVDISVQYETLLIALHHNNKQPFDHADPAAAISGTHGRQGATDGSIVMHRTTSPEDARVLAACYLISRDSEQVSAGMELTGNTWQHIGRAVMATSGELIDMIREVLAEVDPRKWVTTSDLYELIKPYDPGISRNRLPSIISKLVHAGELVSARGVTGGIRLSEKARADMARRKM